MNLRSGPGWLSLAFVMALSGCAQTAPIDGGDAQAPAPPAPQASTTAARASNPDRALPAQELTAPLLYELLMAEIAAQRGNEGMAARVVVDAAKRTRDPRLAKRAVELSNQARMPALALEGATIWRETDPASREALLTLTALLISNRRVEEAEPHLAELLALEGTRVEGGFMQLNRLLSRNPDRAQNARVVRQLADRYPDLPEAHFAVAQAAYAAKDESGALAAVRRAAELRPDWEAPAIFEAQILQAASPDEAIARMQAFLERNPANREARLAYARLLVGAKRYDAARVQFEALLAANPDNPDVIYAVGLLAFQLRDFVTAEANMRRLLTLDFRDRDGARYTLGQIREEQKDWEGALQWYRQVGRGEQYLPAQMRVAQMYAKQGKLGEARAHLRSLGANGQDRVQLLVAEAQLLREANAHSEAFEMLAQALSKTPDQPDLLYDHALTAEKLERYDVLEANLRKLIALRPDHAHAYNALGYSFAERNVQLDEARKLIDRALQLSPDDYFIVDSMGWVLYRQGDLKGAIEYLRRAYRGRPDGEIGAHLGEVLWVSGEREEAIRIWDESLKAHPENESLRKTVQRFRP